MALLYNYKFSYEEILLIWGSSINVFYKQSRIDLQRKSLAGYTLDNTYRNGTPEILPIGGWLWFPTDSQIAFLENGTIYEDITDKPSNYARLVYLDNDKGPRVLFLKDGNNFIYKGAYKSTEVIEKDDKAFIVWRKCYSWEYKEGELLQKLTLLKLVDKDTLALKDIKVLYCHGLASRGNSDSADILRQLGAEVISPDIPLAPQEAITFLQELARTEKPDVIVGSSMGGMLTQKLVGFPKVLVNPAFHVSEILRTMLGTNKFFHKRNDGSMTFNVTKELCDEYERLEAMQFNDVSFQEKLNTVALFGNQDSVLNWEDSKDEYLKYYEKYKVFDGGHRLTEKVIKNEVCHAVLKLLE